MSGTLNIGNDFIGISGSAGSTFNNDGASVLSHPLAFGTINVDVIGTGSFLVGAFHDRALTFAKSVGPDQTIEAAGRVSVSQPNQFAAKVTLEQRGEIDLMGLATADGYTYKNDMLNILSGNKIIDTLHLHNSTLNGFVVER